jgi:transposase
MWTEITRRKYERGGQRYASDLTDGEWALIEPHMPAAKPLGRPREIELRAVLDAILYIARTGCQWRMLMSSRRISAVWAAMVRCISSRVLVIKS